ncbi:hypothetical protein IKF76_00665 [Candidatus Saccharibacteria bacterium]|nr:hypothetical protein [Candidatus Saccharibacteria bacterium]
MFELVISTKMGARHSVAVRDVYEANAELERFKNDYLKSHPNDEIEDASVLNDVGDRVSRYYNGQLEDFN